jgi:hypothetical protein
MEQNKRARVSEQSKIKPNSVSKHGSSAPVPRIMTGKGRRRMTEIKQDKHRSEDAEKPVLQDHYREVGPAAVVAALLCATKKIKASAPAKAA